VTSRALALLLLGPVALPAAAAGDPAAGYVVAAADAPRTSLLSGDAAAWKSAARVRFGPEKYATEFAALWAPDALYLRWDATDPAPWHTMTRRDEHLWEEEVVEIFLDLDGSGRNYAEIEVSAGNVVCDVRMVQPSPDKKMDFDWNLAGLESRVMPLLAQGGTTGWTAVARLPWDGFRSLPSARSVTLPPRAGDAWHFNVFRVERPGGPQAPEKDAVEVAWSDPGEPSFHVPAAFRPLRFAAAR
jgi:hypothetical protein